MDSSKIQQNNLRLMKNTIAMYIRTLIVMVISLYITRVVLKKLGVEDYGVYNVVGTVVVLFAFLNSTMSQTIQRFITVEQGAGDNNSIIKVFNISLIVQTVIALLLIVLCETVGLYVLNNYLDVHDSLIAANWVFQFSIFTTVINIYRVPFESLVIANERMTFFALASVGDAVMKLGVVFLIPDDSIIKLTMYAGLLSFVYLLSFIIYVTYCRVKFNSCKFRKVWDGSTFRSMMSFSGWSLGGSVTNLATHSAFGVFLNIFYGVIANAALGITNQVSAAVTQFINNFQTSFRPQIVKAYAAGEKDYYVKLISTASKFSYLLIFIPSLLLMINMPLVLGLWLGEYPPYTVAFCRLILVCCMFDALTGAYYCAIAATGNIKRYQLAISVSFTLDFILSLLMMSLRVNPEYLLYSRIATRGIINMGIGLVELKKLVNFDIRMYYKNVVMPLVVSTIVFGAIGEVVILYFSDWNLLWISSILTILPMVFSYRYLLTDSERNNIQLLFNKKWK